MNTAALGTASQKYSAVLYYTSLYFFYNWFVIYCQSKMVCDSFSITCMGHHDQWCQLHWYCFGFRSGVIRNYPACLSKFGFLEETGQPVSKKRISYMRVLTVTHIWNWQRYVTFWYHINILWCLTVLISRYVWQILEKCLLHCFTGSIKCSTKFSTGMINIV